MRLLFILTTTLSSSLSSVLAFAPPSSSSIRRGGGSWGTTVVRPSSTSYSSSLLPLRGTTLKRSGDVPPAEGDVVVVDAGDDGVAAAEEEKENDDSSNDVDDDDDDAVVAESIDAVEASASSTVSAPAPASVDSVIEDDDGIEVEEEDEEYKIDAEMMRSAMQLAGSRGGKRGASSPFPKPIVGAIIVSKDGRIIGKGRSSYKKDAVRDAIADAGISVTPLREWCVTWPSDPSLRNAMSGSTLYVTLEPSSERTGTSSPPITQLIAQAGIGRCVIGCADPVPEKKAEGAAALHSLGLSVTMGVEEGECEGMVREYGELANSKLHRMARKHYKRFNRPLGFLHCSVVDSDDVLAFARHGNAFGRDLGGKDTMLSYRDFGTYELAPPPESIWARDGDDEVNDGDDDDDDMMDDDFDDAEVDDFFNMEFEDEDFQDSLSKNPMMPWYEQVDACVVTFPKPGNGPSHDDSVMARLNGLKWLATNGNQLPAAVERIIVMDATDLMDIPLTNDDVNLPRGVDVEAFWRGKGRKPTRVLLRHATNAQAISAAESASRAAEAAARAAKMAKDAIESGDSEAAAEAAMECQRAAMAATEFLQTELQAVQDLKQKLVDKGVVVETIKGGEPIDVMNHLGERSGYKAVVWRAGCWGERGVQSILAGAFQWVSAHLAVDAVGGKFWQLMLAEQAVQAACGAKSRVKVFSEQEDISLEYCDSEDADKDCNLTIDGKPVRHVRLDCRVALIDPDRPRRLSGVKTVPLAEQVLEAAPWFL